MNEGRDSRKISELVHKRAATEALVTAVETDSGGWLLRARLPAHHSFYNDTVGRQAGFHDPIFVLEAFRQGCIAASHVGYGVPLDFRFVLRHYQFAVVDLGALASSGTAADFEFTVAIRREFRAAGPAPVSGLEVEATATRDGVEAMRLSGAFGWMPEESWRRIRGEARAHPAPPSIAADPENVGRRHRAHVVIGEPRARDDGSAPDSTSAPILVDTRSPTFFDHPLDHLPGSLILEGCRQLALAVSGPRASAMVGPLQLRCDFHSFAELSPECVVTLAPAGAQTFRGEVTQDGHSRASVTLSFADPGPPR